MLESIRAYRNNPLIAAAGQIRSEDEWLETLGSWPALDDAERALLPHERIHVATSVFSEVFVPRPAVIDLAMDIDLMLRQSYVQRNPMDGSRARLLATIPTTEAEIEAIVKASAGKRIITSSLAGVSGVGKSTAIERILTSYPQVVFHEEPGLTQVLWLKLDVPANGSVKQLAMAFIAELEAVLGEKLPYNVSDRKSVNTLLLYMMRLCATYSIGLLVIDEVQNLTAKKSEGREVMLNVFQEICNTIHVALFVIGTTKALELFATGGRIERRMTAFGSYVWDRLQDDEEWEAMLDTFWYYQLTDETADLTDELRAFLYDATQGIVALLPALLNLAQNRAILAKKPAVTLDILAWVAANRFKPMHRALEALRSGDVTRQAAFEDLYSVDFLEMVQKVRMREFADAKAKAPRRAKNLSPKRKALLALIDLGYDIELAEGAIDEVCDEPGLTATQIVKRAREILSPVQVEATPAPGDLRYAVSRDAG